jgi:hypothetical protein
MLPDLVYVAVDDGSIAPKSMARLSVLNLHWFRDRTTALS